METKGFFSILNHPYCLSYLLLFHLNTYVMGLRPLEIFQFFQCGDRLYMSRSDVHRRQNLTFKDGPHAEKVTAFWARSVVCHRGCAYAVTKTVQSLECAVRSMVLYTINNTLIQ